MIKASAPLAFAFNVISRPFSDNNINNNCCYINDNYNYNDNNNNYDNNRYSDKTMEM